jgi:hypothetical protein
MTQQTFFTATIKVVIDPRMCNASDAGACDWLSETLRELMEHGLIDWAYTKDMAAAYFPLPYTEGDLIKNEHL